MRSPQCFRLATRSAWRCAQHFGFSCHVRCAQNLWSIPLCNGHEQRAFYEWNVGRNLIPAPQNEIQRFIILRQTMAGRRTMMATEIRITAWQTLIWREQFDVPHKQNNLFALFCAARCEFNKMRKYNLGSCFLWPSDASARHCGWPHCVPSGMASL